MPVTASVTGCSTCRRVFTSRKKNSPVVVVEQELDGAGGAVAERAREAQRGVAHRLAQRGVDPRRGRLLEDLLVATLDRALALAEVHELPVGVAEDLDLDVAGARDVALEEDAIVAEAARRLAPRRRDRLVELAPRASTMRMPLPPPPAAAFTSSG